MTAHRSGRHETNRDAGSWILVEERGRLLSIGTSLFHGQAPKTYLDPIASSHLLPTMITTLSSAQRTEMTFTALGQPWDGHIVPVLGASALPHAVLGCYLHRGAQVPEPPTVGGWEWDVVNERSSWGTEVFTAHGYRLPKPGAMQPTAAQWFAMLDEGGNPITRAAVARFMRAASPDQLHVHLFRVGHATSGGIRHLRLAGRTYFDAEGRPTRLRGVTALVDGHTVGAEEQLDQQQFVEAILQMSPTPICVVSHDANTIFLNSTSWDAVGVDMPPDHRLSSAVHPDDLETLRNLLVAARPAWHGEPTSTRVRFRSASEWTWVDVSAVRLEHPVAPGGIPVDPVMIRLG